MSLCICSYVPNSESTLTMGKHLTAHGDGVKDVAFSVEDLDAIMVRAKQRGVKVVKDIWTEEDKFGKCRFAVVQTYGETTHTFIERQGYNGIFLPGYEKPRIKDALLAQLPPVGVEFIDHIVGNQPDLNMEDAAKWYVGN